MRAFIKILAAVAVVALCAGGAQAVAFNFSDTTQRLMAVETEGDSSTDCRSLFTNPQIPLNPTTGAPACDPLTPGTPFPCPNHPNNRAPQASCYQFATDGGGDYSDPAGDFYGTATYIGNGGSTTCPTCEWNLTTEPEIWAASIQVSVNQAGAVVTGVTETLSVDIDVDDADSNGYGEVQAASTSGRAYLVNVLFSPYNMDLSAIGQTADDVFFGQANDPNTGDPEQGQPINFSCTANPGSDQTHTGSQDIVCSPPCGQLTDSSGNFGTGGVQPLSQHASVLILTGASSGEVVDITTDGTTTLGIATPSATHLGVPNVFEPAIDMQPGDTFAVHSYGSAASKVSFGPNKPLGKKASLCTPANYVTSPGYHSLGNGDQVVTNLATAFVQFTVPAGPGQGTFATAPAWGPQDWRLVEEADADNDGVPDALDNCVNRDNGPLSRAACYTPGITTWTQVDTDSDGFGNPCDGDFNQSGIVDASDFGSPYFLDDFTSGADPGTGTDMNCSGIVDATDFGSPLFLDQFTRGNPGP